MGEPQPTEDGRFLVIEGRRWRASDPSIPAALRAELVAELMDARRAVRMQGEPARRRVQDAKVALGERGRPWWEPLEDGALAERIVATTNALLRHRPSGSVCPSEVARVVGGSDWRSQLERVRSVASAQLEAGTYRITQRGIDVEAGVSGPIRIRRGPRFVE